MIEQALLQFREALQLWAEAVAEATRAKIPASTRGRTIFLMGSPFLL
jgi:hypothetical protein